jgi:hypothetical protein
MQFLFKNLRGLFHDGHFLLPTIIAVYSYVLFTNALNTPHPKTHKEPPPCITRTFSANIVCIC